MNMLSAPLRDRFGMTFHLDFYELDDIQVILERSAGLLKFLLMPMPSVRLPSAGAVPAYCQQVY